MFWLTLRPLFYTNFFSHLSERGQGALIQPGLDGELPLDFVKGARRNLLDEPERQRTILRLIQDEHVNVPRKHGDTFLHQALRSPTTFFIAAELLRRGADVTLKNEKGETSLHQADAFSFLQKHPGLADRFKPAVDIKNNDELTPLARQLQFGHHDDEQEVVKTFVERLGADVNTVIKDEKGELIPLITYCMRNYWDDTVSDLLDRGADVNIPDSDGYLPLHISGTFPAQTIEKILSMTTDEGIKKSTKPLLFSFITEEKPDSYEEVKKNRAVYKMVVDRFKAEINTPHTIKTTIRTPLFAALLQANGVMAEQLVEQKADLTALPWAGEFLSLMANNRRGFKQGISDCLELLHKNDPQLFQMPNEEGVLPIDILFERFLESGGTTYIPHLISSTP